MTWPQRKPQLSKSDLSIGVCDGQPAKLCHMGHALMEKLHGLAVDGGVTQATGTAERRPRLPWWPAGGRGRRITLGTDKAYDLRAFTRDLRGRKITPHIASMAI